VLRGLLKALAHLLLVLARVVPWRMLGVFPMGILVSLLKPEKGLGFHGEYLFRFSNLRRV